MIKLFANINNVVLSTANWKTVKYWYSVNVVWFKGQGGEILRTKGYVKLGTREGEEGS